MRTQGTLDGRNRMPADSDFPVLKAVLQRRPGVDGVYVDPPFVYLVEGTCATRYWWPEGLNGKDIEEGQPGELRPVPSNVERMSDKEVRSLARADLEGDAGQGAVTYHRQVHIEHGAQSADVDAAIVPLILGLWRVGVETLASCQNINESGLVWVLFRTAADGKRFAAVGRGSLWPPIETLTITEDNVAAAPDTPYDCPPGAVLSSVRFPWKDLKHVLARVRQHNTMIAAQANMRAGHKPKRKRPLQGPRN